MALVCSFSHHKSDGAMAEILIYLLELREHSPELLGVQEAIMMAEVL